ncbi:hypothetical protein VNO77_43954 [Canavalia gladiata]|uniref:Uncharacterized protein n=1 Tax=Canavalia gladiata TaxID=3824 RepID=A0AAN9JV60_CANGL
MLAAHSSGNLVDIEASRVHYTRPELIPRQLCSDSVERRSEPLEICIPRFEEINPLGNLALKDKPKSIQWASYVEGTDTRSVIQWATHRRPACEAKPAMLVFIRSTLSNDRSLFPAFN